MFPFRLNSPSLKSSSRSVILTDGSEQNRSGAASVPSSPRGFLLPSSRWRWPSTAFSLKTVPSPVTVRSRKLPFSSFRTCCCGGARRAPSCSARGTSSSSSSFLILFSSGSSVWRCSGFLSSCFGAVSGSSWASSSVWTSPGSSGRQKQTGPLRWRSSSFLPLLCAPASSGPPREDGLS